MLRLMWRQSLAVGECLLRTRKHVVHPISYDPGAHSDGGHQGEEATPDGGASGRRGDNLKAAAVGWHTMSGAMPKTLQSTASVANPFYCTSTAVLYRFCIR